MNELLRAANAMAPDNVPLINLESESIIELSTNTTSKGNQQKWYDADTCFYIKEQFYYQGIYWKDYMVENLATIFAEQCHSDIIVRQSIVKLSNGRYGIRSKDFATDGSRFIPAYKFVNPEKIDSLYGWTQKVYEYLLDTADKFGVDWKDYLNTMIIFDYLLGNEDRHLNNFGLLYNEGIYKLAPLFDFGLGLFEHDTRYINKSLQQCKVRMDGKPFNTDLQAPVNMLLHIDKEWCNNIISRLTLPNRELFPSKLAYEYTAEALSFLKGRCF